MGWTGRLDPPEQKINHLENRLKEITHNASGMKKWQIWKKRDLISRMRRSDTSLRHSKGREQRKCRGATYEEKELSGIDEAY